jgi:hypothetical protein
MKKLNEDHIEDLKENLNKNFNNTTPILVGLMCIVSFVVCCCGIGLLAQSGHTEKYLEGLLREKKTISNYGFGRCPVIALRVEVKGTMYTLVARENNFKPAAGIMSATEENVSIILFRFREGKFSSDNIGNISTDDIEILNPSAVTAKTAKARTAK